MYDVDLPNIQTMVVVRVVKSPASPGLRLQTPNKLRLKTIYLNFDSKEDWFVRF